MLSEPRMSELKLRPPKTAFMRWLLFASGRQDVNQPRDLVAGVVDVRRDAQRVFAQADVNVRRAYFLVERGSVLRLARGNTDVGTAPGALGGRGEHTAVARQPFDDFVNQPIHISRDLIHTNARDQAQREVESREIREIRRFRRI